MIRNAVLAGKAETTKTDQLRRETLAIEVVHGVIDVLRTFGLIKEGSDAQLGQAILEAAQHIEGRVR